MRREKPDTSARKKEAAVLKNCAFAKGYKRLSPLIL